MIRKFYLIIIVIFSSSLIFENHANAQTADSAFDSIYVHAATVLAAQDIQNALHIADSLYENSENTLQEIKSLMLIATLKGRTGNTAEALANAIKAEGIARKEKNHEWQVRIAGFLSTTFREINLTEEGKKYIEVADKANKAAKSDSPNYNIIHAFIHQEKAYYKIQEADFEAAIQELEKAENAILITPEVSRNKIFLATNYHMLGTSLLGLNEYEMAREKLNLALNELGDQESELKAFIYTSFAEIEMHYKNYDAAFEYYSKAEAYTETSQNFNVKSSLFKGLSNYYKIRGNQKEAIRYNELYTEYVKDYSNATKEISNQLIQQLRLEKEKTTKSNYLLGGTSLFLLLVVVFLLLFFQNIRKKERIKYEGIIGKIRESKPLFKTVNYSSKRDGRESSLMPKETEERILSELNKLEKATFYIQKDISLSALATRLQTNPKYLSYVINTHKGKDFNNYINELRIGFVVDKLHNHPEYLNYKLAYIADECGFSSHSKFTAVFKNATQISPSAFISHLKNDHGKN